ncbi:DUF2612 domain-containing protein [bacterium]|nr:DUF2612 domain-containing protein [bacterium]
MTILDHKKQAFDLTLNQYKTANNLIGFVNSVLDVSQNIEYLTQTLFEKFNIDTFNGDFLDAIGQLLALERFPVQNSIVGNYFQFDTTPLDEGYRFFDGIGDTPYVLVNDEFYYRALKSWSVTLNSVGTVNDLILSISYLFNCAFNLVTVTVLNFNSIEIHLNFAIEIAEQSMYDYVTKSGSRLWTKVAGVEYTLTHL